MMKTALTFLMGVLFSLSICPNASAFTHPGIPLTVTDLDAIKAKVQANEEPWKTGYSLLAGDSHSSLTYTMQGPFAHVGRNESGTNPNLNQWRSDMIAIWNLSRMWYFTGNTAYAQKAHDILLAWANTQTSFGGIESGLDLGDYAYRFGGGADILRGTWPGWAQADTDAVKNLFANVYWPATSLISDELGPTNKGSLSLAAAVAIAVFCDDQTKLDKVVYELCTFASTGFRNTLSNGEHGETGRDEGHAYAHILAMSFISEVLWKQGIDVFAESDNRLLAMGEYYVRENLLVPPTFVPMGTTDEYYLTNWGTPGFAAEPMAFNILKSAYVLRKGMSAPWVERKLATQGQNMDAFMFLKSADSSTAAPPAAITFPSASLVSTGLTNTNINGASGSGTYNNGVWTVSGAGTDIWTHGTEKFHFLYKRVTGDCTMIAKVNSVQNTTSTAKAGVMIRSDLNATPACKAWVAIRPDSHVETYFHGWSEMYGGSNWEAQSYGISQSVWWVKVERLGNMVTTYASPDGTSWATQAVGRCENLGTSPYLGICVTSLVSGTPCTATFSNVSITGGNGVAPLAAPDAPLSLLASPGEGRVPLRWTSSFGATSYNVKRATASGGPYPTIVTSLANPSYLDTNVTPNTTYYYVVSAVNSFGEGPDSPQDNVTTPPLPLPPTGVTALPGIAQATLFWAASSGATSYNVKRSTTSGSGYGTVGTTTPPSFTDTGLTNGLTYYYVVSAVSAAGEGGDSPEVSVVPSAAAATALFWSGAVNGTWDTATANWSNGGVSATYANGNAVIFDDSAIANTTINLSASRSPGPIFINNLTKNYTISGSAISGTARLVKQGGGPLTLGSANSYSGGTTHSGGTLTIGNAGSLGTGALTLSGGTLNNSAGFTLGNSIVVSGTGSAIQLGSANNLTLSGGISGSGDLTLGNSPNISSIYLTGANTMSDGAITIANNQNYVRFASTTAGNANADLVLNNTQTGRTSIEFTTGTISFGSLSGNGLLQGNNSSPMNVSLSVGANNHSTTFSGILHNNRWGTGTIGLTKVGSGTLTLTGANDYTGATLVNSGALVVSTISVANGAYSVANGATLGIANTSGGSALLTSLTTAAGATLEFQNVASTTTPLISTGNVTVNGACTVKLNGAAGLTPGNSYPLVNFSGSFQGTFSNLQLQMPSGWAGTLVNNAGQIAVAVSLVPPPPAAPTGLIATGGNASASLTWSASSGASSYTVWRSQTSGGGYTPQGSATATNYNDTSLEDGTTCYYVVTASNPGGASGNSNESSAATYTTLQNWRSANFGTIADAGNAADSADPDGDGSTNAQEFAAGTVPNDPNSVFKVAAITREGTDVHLTFPSVVGKLYRLQSSETLNSNSWTTIQENIPGTGQPVTLSQPHPTSQPCFFRIAVP
ncbi:autotransporter-associated beta strand repeat-containing protein [Luteolibacter sp.]|uniref:autotransporter-associated beta strand repeat-containing protein n=1 Tax=Luteolibacter sp. TaxID=1962973 RepID=UPI0032636431